MYEKFFQLRKPPSRAETRSLCTAVSWCTIFPISLAFKVMVNELYELVGFEPERTLATQGLFLEVEPSSKNRARPSRRLSNHRLAGGISASGGNDAEG